MKRRRKKTREGSQYEPLFCESRFGALQIANHRFEVIRASRSNVMKTSRGFSKDFSLLVAFLLVTFSWLFRGPLLSRKTVFGPFSLLFRGFFVAPVLGKFYAYSPWNSLLKKTVRILIRKLAWISCGIFSALFSLSQTNPRKIHARNHTKIHANFEKIFPTGSSGCSALVYFAAIGCAYLHVDKPRLASLTFHSRNFPNSRCESLGHLLTPNMTGRRVHRTMEMIPRPPLVV